MRVDSAGNIIVTRANSGYADITPKDSDGKPYEMQEGDKIIFTAAKVYCGEVFTVIRKEYTADDYDAEQKAVLLHLTPDDTDLPPGLYDYDCLYVFADEDRETFVRRGKLKICSRISREDDEENG